MFNLEFVRKGISYILNFLINDYFFKVPTEEQLSFLPVDEYDIVAIGTEECERSISVCFFFPFIF